MDTLYAMLTVISRFIVDFVVRLSENVLQKLCNYSLATVDEVEMHI